MEDNPSVTEYFLEYHDNADSVDFWTKGETSVPGDQTEWTQTGLIEGHSYIFHVIAVNSKGESEPLTSNGSVQLGQTQDTLD